MINDPTNDPSEFERLTNDAMADNAPEEIEDPDFVNWEADYYGHDLDGDEFADDFPF